MSFEDAWTTRAPRLTVVLYFEDFSRDAPVPVVTYELSEFTIVLGEPLLNNNLFICRLKTPG
jgi:hypothetical protein